MDLRRLKLGPAARRMPLPGPAALAPALTLALASGCAKPCDETLLARVAHDFERDRSRAARQLALHDMAQACPTMPGTLGPNLFAVYGNMPVHRTLAIFRARSSTTSRP